MLSSDYWHQTRNNKSPSISISSSVIAAGNFKEVIVELEEECAGRGSIFAPTGGTCTLLKEKCYVVWENMFYGGNSASFKKLISTDNRSRKKSEL